MNKTPVAIATFDAEGSSLGEFTFFAANGTKYADLARQALYMARTDNPATASIMFTDDRLNTHTAEVAA